MARKTTKKARPTKKSTTRKSAAAPRTPVSKAATSQGRQPPDEARAEPEHRNGSLLRVYGQTGLRRTGRLINEEFDPRLKGSKAIKAFGEMGDNSPGIGAALLLIESLLTQVEWRFEAPEGAPAEAQRYVDFYESCREDMESTWAEFMFEASTLVQFGHATFESLFKLRRGRNASPLLHSVHNDGLIGWRDFAPRSQDSIDEWALDDEGRLAGFWQDVPGMPGTPFVPRSKMLHFALRARKRNPQGRSPLRAAYRSYFFRMLEEEFEAIGIERNLDGLPVARVPAEYLSKDATPEQQELVKDIFQLVRRVRRDEVDGIVYPAATDQDGNATGFDLDTFQSGQDVSKADVVIKRHQGNELVAMLSSFLELGTTEVGGWALHDSATNLLSHALGAVLMVIADEINRRAVPQLARLNAFPEDLMPQLVFGDIEKMDLGRAGTFVQAMVTSGMLIPGPEDEDWARSLADLPARQGGGTGARPMPASAGEVGQALADMKARLDRGS